MMRVEQTLKRLYTVYGVYIICCTSVEQKQSNDEKKKSGTCIRRCRLFVRFLLFIHLCSDLGVKSTKNKKQQLQLLLRAFALCFVHLCNFDAVVVVETVAHVSPHEDIPHITPGDRVPDGIKPTAV